MAGALQQDIIFAGVTHELRTPLNGILGLSQALIEEAEDSHEDAGTLRLIKSSGERLLSLINDILDMSKLKSIKTKLSYAKVCSFPVLAVIYHTPPYVRTAGTRASLIQFTLKFRTEDSITRRFPP